MPNTAIFKTILHQLTQPTAVAILGSVGLHAALGITLPILPIFSQDSDIPRNVRLMELTPQEQLRLPNVSPEVALPFGQFPDATAVFPLSEKFDLPSSSSKLPDLPATPDLKDFKSNPYNYPLSTPSKTVLRGRSTRSFPTGRTRRRQTNRVGSGLANRQQRRNALNNPNLRFDSRFKKPRTDLTPGEALRIFGKVGQAPQPPHNSNANELAALQRERNSQTQTAETNPGEQENNQVATGGTHTLNLSGLYPRAACESKSDSSVVFRVTSSGGPSVTPSLVKNASNPLFNVYAYRALAGQNFSEPGTYNVTVNFNYSDEACASVANRQETPQPVNNGESPSQPERETPQPVNNEERTPRQERETPPTQNNNGESPSRPNQETPQPQNNNEERAPRQQRETPQPQNNNEERTPRQQRETPQPRNNNEERTPRQQRETPQPRNNNEERTPRQQRETPQPQNNNEERTPQQERTTPPTRNNNEERIPQPTKKKPQPSNEEGSTESEGENNN